VYTDTYFFRETVFSIKTTYKLQNGKEQTLTNGGNGGNGGSLAGNFVLNEGVYLKSVKFYGGNYVDWIEFCDTQGNCSSRLGGSTENADNHVLQKDRSVIKSFF